MSSITASAVRFTPSHSAPRAGRALVALVLVAALGCGKGKHAGGDADGGSPASGLLPGASAQVSPALWERVEEAMTPAEVEQILGRGTAAPPAEMDRLYAGMRAGPRGKTWQQHGQTARVRTWYGWVSGADAIHVGFTPTAKYGELVAAKIAVFHEGGGVMWRELSNPPDGLELTRDQVEKMRDARTNPKWTAGADVRRLIVGRWQQVGTKRVYSFLPDGTLKASGDWYKEVTVPYRFVDAEHVEFALPDAYSDRTSGPQTYRVSVSPTGMTLVWRLQGQYRSPTDWVRLPQ